MDPNTCPRAILIVDDDGDILRLRRLLLLDLAPTYDILAMGDAPSTLTYVAERPIQLLNTDYMMPHMNGLRLSAAVKAASPTTHVVMITVYSSTARGAVWGSCAPRAPIKPQPGSDWGLSFGHAAHRHERGAG